MYSLLHSIAPLCSGKTCEASQSLGHARVTPGKAELSHLSLHVFAPAFVRTALLRDECPASILLTQNISRA
ncbi:MAG: hypothetical protein D4R45_03425 [Planctomycetaceae bacterium]|nr:MAG: hypothetical protein D4R45_03425 [Planctomycetaceae bacterium]